MSALTQEQCQLLRQSGGGPVRLLDPDTNQQYVVLQAEAYDRLQSVLGEPDPREVYPALDRALRDEGWNDAQMDDYNRYAYPRADRRRGLCRRWDAHEGHAG